MDPLTCEWVDAFQLVFLQSPYTCARILVHPSFGQNRKNITRHPLGILDDEASIDFIVTSSHVILSKCYLTHAFPRHGFHPPWCITFQVYMIPERNQHQGHEEKGRI